MIRFLRMNQSANRADFCTTPAEHIEKSPTAAATHSTPTRAQVLSKVLPLIKCIASQFQAQCFRVPPTREKFRGLDLPQTVCGTAFPTPYLIVLLCVVPVDALPSPLP